MLSSVPFTSVELLELGHLIFCRILLCNHFVKIWWFKSQVVDAIEALSCSRLNIADISVFVKYTN